MALQLATLFCVRYATAFCVRYATAYAFLHLVGCLMKKAGAAENVTPLFKNGDSQDPTNYRPVSITGALAKVFEQALANYSLIF